MRKILKWLPALALCFTAAHAQVGGPLTTATGDYKGGSTYSAMYKELAKACPNIGMSERETNGSGENIDLLTGNQVNMAWVQSDLLFYTKMMDPNKVSNIRALFPLYPEELHFISQARSKTVGKFAALGIGDKVELTKISELAGKSLGVVGGSAITAAIVNAKTNLNMKLVTYSKNQEMLNALVAGKVDAILVVGGAPHAVPRSLNTTYRIMAIDEQYLEPLSDVYMPAKVSYSNLAQVGVQTVATPALAVTRVYSQRMATRLQEVQKCFHEKLDDLKDSTGTHEKWQKVNAKSDTKWPMYDFK